MYPHCLLPIPPCKYTPDCTPTYLLLGSAPSTRDRVPQFLQYSVSRCRKFRCGGWILIIFVAVRHRLQNARPMWYLRCRHRCLGSQDWAPLADSTVHSWEYHGPYDDCQEPHLIPGGARPDQEPVLTPRMSTSFLQQGASLVRCKKPGGVSQQPVLRMGLREAIQLQANAREGEAHGC